MRIEELPELADLKNLARALHKANVLPRAGYYDIELAPEAYEAVVEKYPEIYNPEWPLIQHYHSDYPDLEFSCYGMRFHKSDDLPDE